MLIQKQSPRGVLSNFEGKHLCDRLFFNKVAGLRDSAILKNRLRNRFIHVNFAKILRTPFFEITPPVAASINIDGSQTSYFVPKFKSLA